MGTIANPDIYIQRWTGIAWGNLHGSASDLVIRDAGVLKAPTLEVNLVETATPPSLYDRVRVIADVDGTDYLMFYGRVYTPDEDIIMGTSPARSEYGFFAKAPEQRTLRDFITWDYQDEQDSRLPETSWTYKTMIEDFLSLPDSGYDTNILLDTDSDAILNAIDGNFNFKQRTLMDGLRAVAETIGYDGYVYLISAEGTADSGATTYTVDSERTEADDYWNIGFIHYKTGNNAGEHRLITDFVAVNDTITHDAFDYAVQAGDTYEVNLLKLKFYKLGTVAASPATTITDPCIILSKTEDISDLKNYILVWGSAEKGFPADGDKFTERAQNKYSPDIWSGLNGETVSDYSYSAGEAPTENVTHISNYCIASNRIGTNHIDLRLDVDNIPGMNYFDALRFRSVVFYAKLLGTAGYWSRFAVDLTDTSSKRIRFVTWHDTLYTTIWKQCQIGFPLSSKEIIDKDPNEDTYDGWGGDSDINLEQIELVDFSFRVGPIGSSYCTGVWLDWLCFLGVYKIDPFQHPTLNPAVKDQTSIDTYGVSVYEHVDSNITSFNQAQKEGARILATMKDPVTRITLKKASYPWLRPTQTVTLNLTSLGISSQTWRIEEVTQSWRHGGRLYTTLDLVYPATVRTPPAGAPSVSYPGMPWLQFRPGYLKPIGPSPIGEGRIGVT